MCDMLYIKNRKYIGQYVTICTFFILLFVLLLYKRNLNEQNDMFILCNAYIASPEKSDYTISLTYVYKKEPIDFSNIKTIEFDNQDSVIVDTFNYYRLEDNKKYKSIGLDLRLLFIKPEIISCEYLKIIFQDDSQIKYAIGNWTFDIGNMEMNDSYLDIWNSPVATANNEEYPYSFLSDNRIVSVKIQIGENSIIEIGPTRNNKLEGCITFNNNHPIGLIRPRIIYECPSGSGICYANICYCGALNVDDKDIKLSFQNSKIIIP